MSVGYLDLGNAAYYLNSNGTMAIGWAQSEDGWYFASESGALISGWYKEGVIGITWTLLASHENGLI